MTLQYTHRNDKASMIIDFAPITPVLRSEEYEVRVNLYTMFHDQQ